MITLYVIQSRANGKRYVGITNTLSRRLREHRSGHTKAGQVLGEFDLVWTQEFPDYHRAREREVFLKSGQGREWLERTLSRSGPACGG